MRKISWSFNCMLALMILLIGILPGLASPPKPRPKPTPKPAPRTVQTSPASFTESSEPSVPAENKAQVQLPEGKIICTFSGGQRDIRVIDAKGEDVFLTTECSFQQRPSVSADGKKIVFENYVDGHWQIYFINRDTQMAVRVTAHGADDIYPSISPDGTMVVYVSGKKLMKVDLAARSIDVLAELSAAPKSPYFSPDGRKVVFTSDGNLCVLDVASGEVSPIGSRTDCISPAFSPDGRSIAFISKENDVPQIFIIDTRGSRERQVTSDDLDKLTVTFSPSGNYLAFDGGPKFSAPRLYYINIDGTGLTKITDADGRWTDPKWIEGSE